MLLKPNLNGTVSLQDADNLVAGDSVGQADTVRVTQDHTDLGRGQTLLGQLADEVDNLLGARLQPGGGAARVRDARPGDTLSVSVHTTHFDSVLRMDGSGCGVVKNFA